VIIVLSIESAVGNPGSMQNGLIERFNCGYREAVLDMYVFSKLTGSQREIERGLKEYNGDRPHRILIALPQVGTKEPQSTVTKELDSAESSQQVQATRF
jgi:hypothetical protein